MRDSSPHRAARAALAAAALGSAACGDVAILGRDDAPGRPRDEAPARPADELPAPSSGSVCRLDPAAGGESAALVWAQAATLVFVREDGSSSAVHTFEVQTGPGGDGTSPSVYVSAAGDYVAAAAMSYEPGVGDTWEAVLLDTEGRLLWRGAEPGYQYDAGYLSAHGAVAYRHHEQRSTRVAFADGSSREYPGVEPLAAPAPDGTLHARSSAGPDDPGIVGTLDLTTGAFSPLPPPAPTKLPLAGLGDPWEVSGGRVYVGLAGGAARIVLERGDDVSLAVPPVPSPQIEAVTPGGAALVGEGSWSYDAPRWIVDLPAGATTQIPALGAYRPFGYSAYHRGPRLGEDGALAILRTEEVGGLFRAAPGATWTPVGGLYRDVWDVDAMDRAGTYVLLGSDAPGYFPMDPWSRGGEADLAGPIAQVARLDGSFAALPAGAGAFAISPGGACVAFVEEGALRVVDATTFELFDVLPAGERSSMAPLWIDGGAR
jgi:hypothetical protein